MLMRYVNFLKISPENNRAESRGTANKKEFPACLSPATESSSKIDLVDFVMLNSLSYNTHNYSPV